MTMNDEVDLKVIRLLLVSDTWAHNQRKDDTTSEEPCNEG